MLSKHKEIKRFEELTKETCSHTNQIADWHPLPYEIMTF